MKRSQWVAALYLTLLFAGGVVLGALGHKMYDARTVGATNLDDPEQWRKRYVEDFTASVQPTPEQSVRLNEILDESRARYEAVMQRYKPEMRQIHGEQIEKVRSMLNDEQRARYDKWHEERRERYRKLGEKRKARMEPPSGP